MLSAQLKPSDVERSMPASAGLLHGSTSFGSSPSLAREDAIETGLPQKGAAGLLGTVAARRAASGGVLARRSVVASLESRFPTISSPPVQPRAAESRARIRRQPRRQFEHPGVSTSRHRSQRVTAAILRARRTPSPSSYLDPHTHPSKWSSHSSSPAPPSAQYVSRPHALDDSTDQSRRKMAQRQ